MKKLAVTLVMSLLLQSVTPVQVMAAENEETLYEPIVEYADYGDYEIKEASVSDMPQEECDVVNDNVEIIPDEQAEEIVGEAADEEESKTEEIEFTMSNYDAGEATELKGFIQEKYYSMPDDEGQAVYKLFVGVPLPDEVSSVDKLTDVSYQIDSNKPVELGEVSSDFFKFNTYNNLLTFSLEGSPLKADEGQYTLTVNFTVDGTKYKIADSTELVDDRIMIDGKDGSKTQYFSSNAGSTIEQFYPISVYSFWEEKLSGAGVKLVSEEDDSEIAVNAHLSSVGREHDRRIVKNFVDSNKKGYWLNENVLPKGRCYHIDYDWNIFLTKDVTEGYYDAEVSTSSGIIYTREKAYYATSKPVVFGVSTINDYFEYACAIYNGSEIEFDNHVFFSDNTGNYVTAFVYGLNITSENIPTFYKPNDESVLTEYDSSDQNCGYEYGSKWGSFFSLKKTEEASNLELDDDTFCHATVAGDNVIYSTNNDYFYSYLENEGVFFVEYLKHGQLYNDSSGWVRLYLGAGTKCSVGDTLTYILNSKYTNEDDEFITLNYSDKVAVKKNIHGKYIEFGEDSEIFKNWETRNRNDEIKDENGTTITYGRRISDIGISSKKNIDIPAGYSWEVHSIGEITKAIYSGTNTGSQSVPMLTSEQKDELIDQGVFRVCIYEKDGTVWYRQLVCFVDKGGVDISGISVSDSVYTGKAVSYSGTPSVITDDGENVTAQVSISYSYGGMLADGTIYTASEQAPVNVGNYMLTVSVSDPAGEYSGSKSYIFKITPTQVKITASDVVLGVGAELPKTYEYSVTGLLNKDELVKKPEVVCDVKNTEQEGTYTITPSGADAGLNYEISYIEGKLTVRKEVKVTISDISMEDSVYTGKPVSISGSATVKSSDGTDVTKNVKLQYSYSGTQDDGTKYESSGTAPTNTGSYTLTVSTPNDSVYKGQETFQFKITPAEVTVTASDLTLALGVELPKNFAFKATGLLNNDKLIKEPDVKCSVSDTSKAGTFDLVPSGADAGKNYEIKYKNGTLTITGEKIEVRFDVQGYGLAPAAISVQPGEKIAEPDTPTVDGFVFSGWYKEAECINVWDFAKDTVAGSMVLYAKWVSTAKKYTITYVLNGGTENPQNPDSYDEYCETITLAAPTKEGYTFLGWYKDVGMRKGVSTIPKGSSENKTFYAKWTANKYNVKFNKNGGKGKMSTLKNKVYDKKFKLSANKFTRKGYKFAGWNTKKDGSGTQYKNKESVKNLTSKAKGTVTLYAQWKKKKK